MFERRNQRTTDPVEALTLLLDSHRDRLGARTLALSTPEGVVLAGSGDAPERAAQIGSTLADDDAGLRLDTRQG